MKLLLFLIVLFFSSFNLEYREKWVCHTTIVKTDLETCLVVVIRAETKQDAEAKFKRYIKRKELQYSQREIPSRYAIFASKDAIMIEP